MCTPATTHDEIVTHEPSREFLLMERAIRELLVAKGVFPADDVRRQIDLTDSRSEATRRQAGGARLGGPGIQEAPARRPEGGGDRDGDRRLQHARAGGAGEHARLHHLVTCTLCSCYPKAILGIPPAWYKSVEYRARAVVDPRGVLQEFGTDLGDDVELRVLDSTADMRYLVLPLRPDGSEGMSETALAGLVTRDSMIGVTTPRRPN